MPCSITVVGARPESHIIPVGQRMRLALGSVVFHVDHRRPAQHPLPRGFDVLGPL